MAFLRRNGKLGLLSVEVELEMHPVWKTDADARIFSSLSLFAKKGKIEELF